MPESAFSRQNVLGRIKTPHQKAPKTDRGSGAKMVQVSPITTATVTSQPYHQDVPLTSDDSKARALAMQSAKWCAIHGIDGARAGIRHLNTMLGRGLANYAQTPYHQKVELLFEQVRANASAQAEQIDRLQRRIDSIETRPLKT